MGNTNSMISLMFEEIKVLLVSIDKKLNERATIKEIPSHREIETETKPNGKPYDTPQCSDNKCSELRYFHAAICVG